MVKEIFGCNFFLVGFCSLAGWLEQQNTHSLAYFAVCVCVSMCVCCLFASLFPHWMISGAVSAQLSSLVGLSASLSHCLEFSCPLGELAV